MSRLISLIEIRDELRSARDTLDAQFQKTCQTYESLRVTEPKELVALQAEIWSETTREHAHVRAEIVKRIDRVNDEIAHMSAINN